MNAAVEDWARRRQDRSPLAVKTRLGPAQSPVKSSDTPVTAALKTLAQSLVSPGPRADTLAAAAAAQPTPLSPGKKQRSSVSSLPLGDMPKVPQYSEESDIFEDVVVTLRYEDGRPDATATLKIGETVQSIKTRLSREVEAMCEYEDMRLKMGDSGREMMDPLSLNDFPEIRESKRVTILVTCVRPRTASQGMQTASGFVEEELDEEGGEEEEEEEYDPDALALIEDSTEYDSVVPEDASERQQQPLQSPAAVAAALALSQSMAVVKQDEDEDDEEDDEVLAALSRARSAYLSRRVREAENSRLLQEAEAFMSKASGTTVAALQKSLEEQTAKITSLKSELSREREERAQLQKAFEDLQQRWKNVCRLVSP